jgi:nucleoside-diphosphate-sugar epimerase
VLTTITCALGAHSKLSVFLFALLMLIKRPFKSFPELAENVEFMHNQLHTVLGASGAIGRAVISELQSRNLPVRAVARRSTYPAVETVAADLLNSEEAHRVIAGSSHVYLCVGLPYRTAVWATQWPQLMRNMIDACAAANANLIFFDNVYLYGPPPLQVPFDEGHPQNPVTKKGQARKQTADLLMNEFQTGRIKGLIGRSADFYGPYAVNGPFYISFLERMLKGKSPQSIYPTAVHHTYAYTGDLAKALVMLALDSSAYGQVWHLPAGAPITLSEVTMLFNVVMNTGFTVSQLPDLLQKILSLFIPPLREVREMRYQFDHEYVISFEKFLKRFPDFRSTQYETGIREMIKSFEESETLKKNI